MIQLLTRGGTTPRRANGQRGLLSITENAAQLVRVQMHDVSIAEGYRERQSSEGITV